MNQKTKLKIGEFSKLMQVTVKTLRHYEQKGLLLPEEVDEWSGYRFYGVGQMQRFNSIRNFRDLGFSLEEIRELFDDDTLVPPVQKLAEKIEETEAQLQRLRERRDRLLQWMGSRKQLHTMEKFSIQSLPQIIVASHREVIPNYAALGLLCCEKIGPEMQRLGCKCPPKKTNEAHLPAPPHPQNGHRRQRPGTLGRRRYIYKISYRVHFPS